MIHKDCSPPDESTVEFGFRPWVRRAGLSILLMAAGASSAIFIALATSPASRYGWFGESFVWIYVGALWAGGAKVYSGTFGRIAEVGSQSLILRPLHHFRARKMSWQAIRGTEQSIGGDRLIVWYETPRGSRFVALNLNLVKGRREFLQLLDRRLGDVGFREVIVDRSRWMTVPKDDRPSDPEVTALAD